jgi:transposase
LTDDGYGGVPCEVTFTHNGRSVTHRGLVVLSGPMHTALRQTRRRQFRELFIALHHVQAKIGQKRCRTEHELRQRVATQLRHSPVGELVGVEVYTTPEGQLALRWWVDANALQTAQRPDGRYLLVTNDPLLSYPHMLALYRDKDQVEKRFEVAKQHLKIRPLFVHSDERIRAMLLINLIALLTYSLLERQAQQHGLCLTAQAILERLSTLQVHQVEAWDGSQSRTLGDCTPQQVQLLTTLLQAVTQPIVRTQLPRRPSTHPLEVWLLPALTGGGQLP